MMYKNIVLKLLEFAMLGYALCTFKFLEKYTKYLYIIMGGLILASSIIIYKFL